MVICVFVLFVLLVRVKSFRKKKKTSLKLPDDLIYITTDTFDAVTIFDLNSSITVPNIEFFQINMFALLDKNCKIYKVAQNPRNCLFEYKKMAL